MQKVLRKRSTSMVMWRHTLVRRMVQIIASISSLPRTRPVILKAVMTARLMLLPVMTAICH
jgi:hypothetical protein